MDKLFHIFEMDSAFVETYIANTPEGPHFHDFDELIIVTEGSFEHYIDFNMEEVSAPIACFVSEGKVHKLVPKSNLRGWVITYKNEFIPNSRLHQYSNFFSSNRIPLSNTSCLNRFSALCQIIEGEYKQQIVDLPTIKNLVSALISMVDMERKRNMPTESSSKSHHIEAFGKFLKLLEEHYHLDEGVTFYAEKMNMSERNLNIICKNNFQKSVSEIIESRKLTEAKRLLIHTDKSVSEVGFELGYNEKSYFTRVFHSKIGATPSRYRELTKTLIS